MKRDTTLSISLWDTLCTYITNHNNARSMIMKVERDELVEELMEHYIESFTKSGKKSMFMGKR